MRIEAFEINAIKQAIFQHVSSSMCNIFLFGSRVDDNKKGGDIDILVVLKKDALITRDEAQKYKLEMLVDIKTAIGDQKIDLVIAEEKELTVDPFLREIMKSAVML